MAVDRPRHPVVCDRHRVLAEDVLGHQDRLGVPDVRELRGVDDVADRIHAGLAGAAVLVDLDEPAIADLDCGARQTELVGEGSAADADDDDIDFEVLDLATIAGDKWTVVPPSAIGVWPITLTPVRMSMFFFLKLRTTTLATSVSQPGEDLGQAFEDRDLRAEVGERAGELATDGAATDHRDATRDVVEHQDLVARHDRTGAARSRGSCAAPSRRPAPRWLPLIVVTPSGPVTVTVRFAPSVPMPSRIVIFFDFMKPVRLLTMPSTIFCLRACAVGEVDDRCARLDAELCGVGNVAMHCCGLEERLGRDATAVEAGAAHVGHLDEGDVETGGCGVQRCAVSAWSTADHDEIEFGCGLHVGSVTVGEIGQTSRGEIRRLR